MWNKLRPWSEVYVAGIFVVLLVTCVDPLESIMPLFWGRTVVILLIAVYGLYLGVIYREAARDERDRRHLAIAERVGFLVGVGVLVLFLALDAFSVSVEKPLVFALGSMVIAKAISLLVLRYRN